MVASFSDISMMALWSLETEKQLIQTDKHDCSVFVRTFKARTHPEPLPLGLSPSPGPAPVPPPGSEPLPWTSSSPSPWTSSMSEPSQLSIYWVVVVFFLFFGALWGVCSVFIFFSTSLVFLMFHNQND